ncbi:MAG TPA: fused MFS/spermidine synthase [Myxococcales bacterium]|jgi:predicted membrane-bound spermidine synthase
MRISRGAHAAAVLLFFVSGASGLVYEVVWVRALTLVVGHTTYSASLVVAAFLLGLVLGSLAIGRLADRLKRPLLVYGALEAATGVLALGVTALLGSLPRIMSSLGIPGGGPLPLRAAIAFLVVLPPTFVMGGTLPVLTRFVARELKGLSRVFGVLYSINTLGAAVGCGVGGFVLVGALGLSKTAAVAACVNLAIGAAAVVLHFLLGAQASPGEAAGEPERESAGAGAGAGGILFDERRRRLLVAVFAGCGFASIAYEVLWFRVLSSVLDSSAYAFTLLLVTFLLGLVVGGLAWSLWLEKRAERALELFVGVQSLVAYFGLFSMVMLGFSRLTGRLLIAWLRGMSDGGHYVAILLQAAAIILVPASLIGVIFPLIVHLTTRHVAKAASNVGLLYSVNTLGGIVGSLAVGLWLIPVIGTQKVFLLISALNMALALGVQAMDASAPKRARWATRGTAAVLAAGMLLIPSDLLIRGFAEHPDSRITWVKEGLDGVLAVLEYDAKTICTSPGYDCAPGCLDKPFTHRRLVFGAISYANTVLPGRRYMATLAHVPMLLHPAPKDALVVCFGTGTTAGSFASYPDLRSLTLVDTNEDVLEAAQYFAEHNRRPDQDPRTKVVFDDGRHFLLANPKKFDVISFEPPPPQSAGVVSLYTTDFYRLVRERLNPGGLLAQWIPLAEQRDNINRQLVASMLATFPEVSLWIPAGFEAVLVGSDRPLDVDWARWNAQMKVPGIERSLAEVGYTNPYQLLGTYVAGTEALKRWVGQEPVVTDDDPRVEYFLSHGDSPFNPGALQDLAQSPASAVRGEGFEAARLDKELAANQLIIDSSVFKGSGQWEKATESVNKAREIAGNSVFLDHLTDVELACMRTKKRK